VSRYQKGKTNLDFTEARDSEWQWHQLGHMQVCISLQTDNHASTPPLSFLQARCPSCHPTNSVKAPYNIIIAAHDHYMHEIQSTTAVNDGFPAERGLLFSFFPYSFSKISTISSGLLQPTCETRYKKKV